MKNRISKDKGPKDYTRYRTIRQRLKVIFSCLTALPFFIFAYIYLGIGTFNTALSGALIVLALILVLEGFIIFRRMAEHIEHLSTTMAQAEEGKVKRVQETGETKELTVIADTFNRTLYKLEETAKDLGVKAVQAAALHEVREIVAKSIRMEEVSKVILERAMKAVDSPAGYLAVKRDDVPILHVAAASGITEKIPDTIELDATQNMGGPIFDNSSPILIEDVEEEPHLKPLNSPEIGFNRLLYLSIVAKGTFIGTLVLGRDRTQPHFNEEDVKFLQTLLQQVAYSVENAKLYENIQQTNEELKNALISQKDTQNQLLTSARMAAFGELSINIAHELNNPLMGIMGYTDLVLDSSMDDIEKEKHLLEIRSQSIRASQIIKGLLDFAGTGPGSNIQTDVNDLVEKTLLLTKERIRAKGIYLDLKLADELPSIMADPVQMGQVFFNLVSNALNAMTGEYRVSPGLDEEGSKAEERQLSLIIETGRRNGEVYVSFEDTGPGISPEQLAKIFEPFYSTQDKVSEVGLGLWVSHRIVKAHGGIIHVKSDPGMGSIFVVVLPLTEEELKIDD